MKTTMHLWYVLPDLSVVGLITGDTEHIVMRVRQAIDAGAISITMFRERIQEKKAEEPERKP